MPVVTEVATDVTSQVVAAVDALCQAEPAHLGHGETIQALHRQLARLEAATTRATAAFDAGGTWEADGARSAAAWVATRCCLPGQTARRRVRLGRELRHMTATETAWVAGDIHEAHVALLASARTPVTQECFAHDEAMLVGEAARLRYAQFVRVLTYWSQLADPDGTEDATAARHDARRFHLSQGLQGGWFAEGVFHPIGGSVIARALGDIEDELFEADWAEARARVGEGVCGADLARTPAQRRADAMVEMARRSGAVAPGSRLPEPLFSVYVGYETFAGRICELANGTVVTPGSLVPWLDEAWVERVVFDGPDRVKNLGVRRRIFTGGTRRSVQVRDRECFHELCELPAEDCQVDHVQPFAVGGLTVDDNGRAACGYHNRLRHRRT